MRNLFKISSVIFVAFFACSPSSSEEEQSDLVDLGIPPVSNPDANSSYSNSTPDIYVDYYSIPSADQAGNLRDAIAYLDANHDGLTDVFFATGEYLLEGEANSILALNDGSGYFYSSTAEFNGNMPPATHARKTLVSDFNQDGLKDLFVLDHGYDANPYPGSTPKLIMQTSQGSFSWSKLPEIGFFHTGAAADIDQDGDIDIFMGGNDPFFYINDGQANFTRVDNRYDQSVNTVFASELIDVDEDGNIDLLVGAHEQDGHGTSIFWGNSSGKYSKDMRTVLPAVDGYGTVLDFDVEDLDQDGDRDLVINRTGGGAGNFYQGRKVQLLKNNGNRNFSDITSQIDDPGQDTEVWFPWIRIQDRDGDGFLDIISDDSADGLFLKNDGNANFIRLH